MERLVSEVSIKYGGDLFYIGLNPYKFSQVVPHKVESVRLLSGHWGTLGSVINWTYIMGGEKRVAKVIFEDIVEKKKSMIRYKVIGGDLLKVFNKFTVIFEVEHLGEDKQLVTYTFEYEKKGDQVQDPTSFLDFILGVYKDLEGTRPIMP